MCHSCKFCLPFAHMHAHPCTETYMLTHEGISRCNRRIMWPSNLFFFLDWQQDAVGQVEPEFNFEKYSFEAWFMRLLPSLDAEIPPLDAEIPPFLRCYFRSWDMQNSWTIIFPLERYAKPHKMSEKNWMLRPAEQHRLTSFSISEDILTNKVSNLFCLLLTEHLI